MRRAKRFGRVVALGSALLVVLASGSGAVAQEGGSAELELTPIGNSGVSGTATLRDAEGGVEATLDMRGLPEEGVEHLNHFHGGGTCADFQTGPENVPVTIPLDPIVANEDGTGSATTTIEGVTLGQLFEPGQERIIVVHEEAYTGEGIPPGIACADVAPTRRETTQPLPSSGGPAAASVLLPATALLVGASVLTYAVLRRR